MKKLLTIVLSLTMLIGLSGCSTERTSDSTSTDGTVTSDVQGGSAHSEISEPENTASARVTIEGTKFMVDGKELWINGANTPWEKWNDFTVGYMDEAFWDNEFARLVEDGINCTRIWVNCNGQNIVRLTPGGYPTDVNPDHWEALDKLFALAEKHKLYIMPTLLSFDHFKEPVSSGEKFQAMIKSNEYCDRFAEIYVKEFCERYRGCEYIFGIDIINEPDWVFENEECGKIPWDNISYLLGKCAAVIHENSDFPVTVGMAIIKYNSDKYEGNKVSDEYLKELTGSENAYLDFYSTHYYNWQKPWFGFPCDKSPSEFGLAEAKPCLIGETHNDDEKDCGMTLTEKYKSVYDNGWNGIMVWMDPQKKDDGTYDWYRYDLTEEATKAMLEYAPEKIRPLG